MLPKQFNADGMVSGRLVHEGEVIGKVGNFFRRERATTYHLHFDMQVPTKYGWVFVNPYMTLVAGYERLIRGRGQELRDEENREDVPTASIRQPLTTAPMTPEVAAAKSTETAVESPPEAMHSGTRHDERVESSPIKASLPVHVSGRHGGVERHGTRASKPNLVRSMGRGLPRTGARAGHSRRHIHAGYDYYQTGYGSF
jgi:hypothetical protein